MLLTPRYTRLLFTSHITFSVGWLGAVAVFLALAITGLTTQDTLLARSAYLAMELSGWFVIIPFCLASLLTGLMQALGTRWGLFKHYWIVVKLFLTLAGTILLLLHMQPIGYMAGLATDPSFSASTVTGLRLQLIADAGAAILLLLAITTISVYKPWGRTGAGRPKKYNHTNRPPKQSILKQNQKFYMGAGLIGLLILLIIWHLAGDGMHHH